MKKLTALVLTGCMCLALGACGSSEEADTSVQAGETTAEADTSVQADDIAAEEDTSAEESETAAEKEETKEAVKLKIGVPTAPPALPVLRMMDSNALGDNVEIELDIWNEPETLIAMVQDGEHDMFAFPLTVSAKLYNKGLDVRLMNVNTWGVTYFMTSDPDFDSWSDLKGKTVYVPLQSSPPDALTQYFINEAGLTVGEDVEIVYASTAEVASLLASGEAVYGTLIEPQVTKAMMGNENLRVAFSFEKEWQRVTGTDTMIPNAGFGTTQGFIDENPELTAQFNEEYGKALEWVNENPEEAGQLAEKYLGLSAGLVTKAIPNMGLNFKTATEAQPELETFYNLLNDFDASMIGGKIPDTGLNYE